MNYRLLQEDEWDKLKALVPEQFIPSPETSGAAVAEDEQGNLLGVLFMQLVFHVEPLVLTTPQVSFARLYQTFMDNLQDQKGLKFYAFAATERVGQMAEHVGMKEMPYRIYEGEVK